MKPMGRSSANYLYQEQPVSLLDWQYVRRASAASYRAGGTQWWRGVYCHPKRQVQVAQEEYNMAHDIYSLGVCMLEVLLWKSFVEPSGQGPQISLTSKEQAGIWTFQESIESSSLRGASGPNLKYVRRIHSTFSRFW